MYKKSICNKKYQENGHFDVWFIENSKKNKIKKIPKLKMFIFNYFYLWKKIVF